MDNSKELVSRRQPNNKYLVDEQINKLSYLSPTKANELLTSLSDAIVYNKATFHIHQTHFQLLYLKLNNLAHIL